MPAFGYHLECNTGALQALLLQSQRLIWSVSAWHPDLQVTRFVTICSNWQQQMQLWWYKYKESPLSSSFCPHGRDSVLAVLEQSSLERGGTVKFAHFSSITVIITHLQPNPICTLCWGLSYSKPVLAMLQWLHSDIGTTKAKCYAYSGKKWLIPSQQYPWVNGNTEPVIHRAGSFLTAVYHLHDLGVSPVYHLCIIIAMTSVCHSCDIWLPLVWFPRNQPSSHPQHWWLKKCHHGELSMEQIQVHWAANTR